MIRRRSWISVGSLLIALSAAFLAFAGCDRDKSADGQSKPESGQSETTRGTTAVPQQSADLPVITGEQTGERSAPDAASSETTRPEQTAKRQAPSNVPAWQPLVDAKPGEWAEYETLDGRRIKYEVLKVAPSGIQTQITITQDGRTWGEPATREEDAHDDPVARQAERHNAVRTMKSDSIKAAGRDFKATLYEDRWTDEEVQYIRLTWVSNEVPCHGVIRMELTGDGTVEARMELAGYGPK